ncbi:right-handed parallel beta-helix repeat-containing protein [Acinetobacter pittii]|uniref:right-handed parallel beta-helix repeat-containing protein n=1 Tax=Acinetobacter pittii TaxID=48296 RepID=UPI00374EFEE0
MSVPVQTPSKEYIANGTTTAFPLEFSCDKAEYLIVTLNGEEAPLGSWTLANDTVTFNVAPLNGVVVNLQRNTPFQRTTNYQLYDNSFRPSAVNKDFDLIWWKLQELGYRDQVIWLALVKEITDRIDGDEDLQNQINTIDEWLANLQQNVNENTNDIAQLVNDLSKEIADRITNDEALKEMFLAMMDEAINEGTINALAITHVDSLEALEAVVNVWDGRTVYVKDLGHYEYDYATTSWLKVYQDADNVKDGTETQKQINDKSARAFASIEDLLNYTPRGNGQIAFVKSYYADQNTGGRYFKYDSEKANENDGVVVFNGWVGGITNNTITSEMVGIRDGEDAASKFDLLAAFMQNKSYNLRLSGSIFSTKELVLMYLKDSIIEADDLYHVPPLNKPLNNNRGAITIRNSTNVTVQDSYLHGECVAHYDNREDGQAGIVFIDSVGCKALENRIERFHAWAVLGTNCTDTLVTGNTIKHIVRQSGINIWFGSGSNNIARNNTISDVGLYGVEFENHTLLNSDGVAKDNIISDCFQGATLVNLIENAKVVGNEISQCYRGITYSLSTSSAKLRLFRNTVSNCQMGLQHGVAEMRSSRNTYTYEAQSFYKTSPYSSVSAIDADGYVYVAESAGITNGLTWSVGEVVQINGTSYTVSTVATGVSLPNYAYTFVKLKFSVNPTGLRVGDFILHAPNALDNIGMHLYLGGNFNSRLDSIKGYPIPVRESMSTSGGTRQLNSLQVDSDYFVFKFDNVLSNTKCKFTVENLQLTGNANVALVDPTDMNSKTTCNYLSSIGYIRPNGYYTLDFLDAVSYGNFATITQGRRTLKPMQVIAVELEYTNLASNTGNPALLCNDQNLEITLGKVLSGTGVSGIGFTGISPFPINAYLNTFKLITTGSLSDLGYNRLRYKLFYI